MMVKTVGGTGTHKIEREKTNPYYFNFLGKWKYFIELLKKIYLSSIIEI